MLTYSVRPRGGVVHALSVAGALAERGHEVELFAIGPPGTGFFRAPPVPAHVVAHVAPDAPFDERICALIDAYTEGCAGRCATAASTSCTRRTASRPTRR
jgi:hypothetical protein